MGIILSFILQEIPPYKEMILYKTLLTKRSQ